MTSWSGRRVLVTGGGGFIGSHLVELLASEGAEVTALAVYDPLGGNGWLSDEIRGSVRIIQGDVRDAEHVATCIAGHEVVLHLAALIGIPYSYEAVESYVQTNVGGTQNVLQGCRRAGVERVVVTSTSEVYGTARRVPIDETHPLQPQSPYSASKIGADMLALSFRAAFGLPVSVIRPFNVYGPRQSARAVVPSILGQLIGGATELRLGSLSPTRDLTFVEDSARAFLAVAECDRALGNVVNAGSEREISIGALAVRLMTVVNRRVPIIEDSDRVRPLGSEVERLLSDSSRARDWAGWQPTVDLDTGLARTAEWVAANLDNIAWRRYQR